MTPSKQDFGQFVTLKRHTVGLTQRELAQRLFVTESAVSKWERGLSYPDITLVDPLARELGVTERELLAASDDHLGRMVEREALVYRRWRGTVLWTTLIAFGVTVVVCFIVNLATTQTLSWFWVVLSAIAVAFSLTSWPLLLRQRSGWWVLLGFVTALFGLLTACQLLYGGGVWLPIAMAAILLAVLFIFTPIGLGTVVPAPASHHRTVISLAVDTVATAAFVLLVMAVTGDFARLAGQGMLIVSLCAVFPWAAALTIRYLPVAGLYRAAVVTAFVGLYAVFAFTPLVDLVTGTPPDRAVDFARWTGPYLNGNVEALFVLAAVLVAVVLALAEALRGKGSGKGRGQH